MKTNFSDEDREIIISSTKYLLVEIEKLFNKIIEINEISDPNILMTILNNTLSKIYASFLDYLVKDEFLSEKKKLALKLYEMILIRLDPSIIEDLKDDFPYHIHTVKPEREDQ